MSQVYQPQKIRNLQDLHSEQLRVQQAYQNIASEMTDSITTTDGILFATVKSILKSTLKRKKEKKKEKKALKKALNQQQTFSNKSQHPTVNNENEPEKKSYKKLGRSFFIWEAASAVVFIGLSIYLGSKKRKKSQKK